MNYFLTGYRLQITDEDDMEERGIINYWKRIIGSKKRRDWDYDYD